MADIDRDQLGVLLSAYLDGEVTAQEAEQVERILAENEDARRLLGELKRTAQLVFSLPVHPAPSSIAEDLQLQTERCELLGDADDASLSRGGRRSSIRPWLSAAAVLACACVSGWWFLAGQDARSPRMDERVVGNMSEKPDSLDPSLVRRSADAEGERSRGVAGPKGKKAGVSNRLAKKRDKGMGAGLSGRDKRGIEVLPEDINATLKLARGESTAPPGAADERLLTSATLEQKLAASLPVNSLRTHRFGNESHRLRIPVRSSKDRDAVLRRLMTRLRLGRIVDLAGQPRITPQQRVSTDGFYVRGRAGLNFDEAEQGQVLVRLPASKLDGLMAELGGIVKDKHRVVLETGPFRVRGLDKARESMREARDPSVVDAVANVPSGWRGPGVTTPGGTPVERAGKHGPAGSSQPPTVLDLFEDLFGFDLRPLASADKAGSPPAPSSRARLDAPPGNEASVDGKAEHKRGTSRRKRSTRSGGSRGTAPADKVKDRPAEGKHRSAAEVAARKKRETDASAVAGGDETLTLVERRIRALERTKETSRRPKKAAQPKASPAPVPSDADGSPGAIPRGITKLGYAASEERFVTLVLQVVIDEPQAAVQKLPLHKPGKPSSKSGGKKAEAKRTKK